MQTKSYPDAEKFLKAFNEDKEVKKVYKAIPIKRGFTLCDVSLYKNDREEEKFLMFNKHYRHNIRKGITVITEKSENGVVQDTFWVRKGMFKIYNLIEEYLCYNLGEITQIGECGGKDASENIETRKMLFEDVKKAFEFGHQIKIVNMVRANGEMTMISFCQKIDCWIIASKNVSMALQAREDIGYYEDARYVYAYKIANAWFDKLYQIEKKQGNKAIKDLQKALKNKSLIGEYVGHANHQHIVKYNSIEILFFAITEHSKEDICMNPDAAFEFFQKFDLKTVQITNEGIFPSWKDLNIALRDLMLNVAEGDIESVQEGSIVYLCKVDKNTKKTQVLSQFKIKTLEYQIYLKMRDRLIYLDNNRGKNRAEYSLMKYIDDVKFMTKNIKPYRPLAFYFEVAKIAFNFVEDNKQQNLLQEEFISFISVILNCYDRNWKPNPSNFSKDNVNKIFYKSWKQVKKEKVYKDVKESKQNRNLNDETKNCIFIIPVGIPGMGKSVFAKYLDTTVRQNDGKMFIVSMDEIQRESLDQYNARFQDESQQEAKKQTEKFSEKNWWDKTEQYVNLIKTGFRVNGIIYLDKNHHNENLDQTVKVIKRIMETKNMNLKLVALVPKIDTTWRWNEKVYPFHLQFIFNCMSRVQKRKDHLTLPGSGTRSMNTMIYYINLFRNTALDVETLKFVGVHHAIKFHFVSPQKVAIDQKLINSLERVLEETYVGEKCKKSGLLADFEKYFESHQPLCKPIDDLFVQSKMVEVYQDIMKLVSQNLNINEIVSITSKPKISIEKKESIDQLEKEENVEKVEKLSPLAINQNKPEINQQSIQEPQKKKKINQILI